MKRILIVEDEVDSREMLDILLQDEGYEVLTAANGREALHVLESATPDVIVTDIMMPFMGGEELLSELRKDAKSKTIPVIVMSAGDRGEVARRFAAAFVPKPFDIDVFLGVLRKTVGR